MGKPQIYADKVRICVICVNLRLMQSSSTGLLLPERDGAGNDEASSYTLRVDSTNLPTNVHCFDLIQTQGSLPPVAGGTSKHSIASEASLL